jgi:hypothetical protein
MSGTKTPQPHMPCGVQRDKFTIKFFFFLSIFLFGTVTSASTAVEKVRV